MRMIDHAYHRKEVELVAVETGIKKIDANTNLITCRMCGKSQTWTGLLENYRYRYFTYYRNKKGKLQRANAYCCGWSCYVKGLLKEALQKEKLSDQDVLLLMRYHKPVPWERVSATAWEYLPARDVLEREMGTI